MLWRERRGVGSGEGLPRRCCLGVVLPCSGVFTGRERRRRLGREERKPAAAVDGMENWKALGLSVRLAHPGWA